MSFNLILQKLFTIMSIGEKKMSTMYEYLAAKLKLFFSYKAEVKKLSSLKNNL